MADRRDAVAITRTVLPILLFSSVLRSLISLYPWLDISVDVGAFHTQLLHFTSLTIWITLSLICRELIAKLKLGFAAFPIRILVCTALAAPYPILVVNFIYKHWVSSFAVPIQLIYLFPSAGFIHHTIHQAYFITGCLLERCERRPALLRTLPVRDMIKYNAVMIGHMVSVAAVNQNIDTLFYWFYVDLFYRLLAIYVFYYYYNDKAQQEQHQSLTYNTNDLYLNDEAQQNRSMLTFNSTMYQKYQFLDRHPTRSDKPSELVVFSPNPLGRGTVC